LGSKARFLVATQGPLGEPFLEIDPGPTSANLLQAGAVARGTDPPRMDLLTSKLYSFVDEATRMLGSGSDAQTVVHRVTRLAEKAEGTLDEAGPAVLTAVKDLSEAARELKALAHTTSGLVSEKGSGRLMLDDLAAVSAQLRKDVPSISERAQKAVDGAAAVAGALTPEDGQRLRDAIARYEKAGATLGEVASRADRLLARIETGEGTIGGLNKDPAVYQDLKSLVTDLKKHTWKVLW
ncbi:MAG: MCE family protein, partial [Deltaproteobacteria bacterium]|nr:MCE family protein [Deltaproteobacteria bacterium]